MLPFGPITDSKQIVWQRRAARQAAHLLSVAFDTGLPPISWTIATAGSALIGRCQTLREWDAWQAHFHLPSVQTDTVHPAFTGRRANGVVRDRGGMPTHITLVVEIDPDDDQPLDPPGSPPLDAA